MIPAVLNPSGLCQCGCGQPAPLAEQSVTARGYIRGEPVRFIRNHHTIKRSWTARPGPLPTPCWIWDGAPNDLGYGSVWINGRCIKAHVWIWEQGHGAVPPGMELDHLCRRRLCVNPAHLEPVTHRENVLRGESQAAKNARKTHCKHGHGFTPENTIERPNGSRACRICTRRRSREAQRRYQTRLREDAKCFREH
jgi:hypothetical protein